MLRFILRRLIATIPVMLVVAIVVFLLSRLAPGDPATIIAGDFATPAEIEAVRQRLGLDGPLWSQFLIWISHTLSGDLGTSVFSNIPVTALILQRIEPTVSLSISTLILALPTAVVFGVLAAWSAGGWLDRTVLFSASIGFSVPVFVLGFVLVYVFSIQLHITPVQGFVSVFDDLPAFARTMILPALSLAIAHSALLARITRTSVIEVIEDDFNRTAKAKGLSDGGILIRHTLRNAAVPILTIIGVSLAALLSGSIVVENMFNIPGVGRLLIDAVTKRDYPVIQGIVLAFSFVYIVINLLVDIAYVIVDPRIRY